jgi:hypothetical protein
MPLATLAWPETFEQARAMRNLPLEFVRCVDCGHIFNAAFDYREVPYSKKPNLMFNRGRLWAGFVEGVIQILIEKIPKDPVVVEVGYGDGAFLQALARHFADGRFVGFDPYGAGESRGLVSFRKALFEADVHLPELEPDLIVTRHVLEHMSNPLAFLQRVHVMAGVLDIQPIVYVEVPCVDRLLETGRTVDLYYEHNSQFTTDSFRHMLERSGGSPELVGHGYNGEITYGLVRMAGHSGHCTNIKAANDYRATTQRSLVTIRSQLDHLCQLGRRVAIWGGTGKSAAFMNRYGVDAGRFPFVIDSDRDKVDTYVPGTGQKIRFRDWLKTNPVDIIIVPSQWRAADIAQEITREGIVVDSILIEHKGSLVDFLETDNPYR